jgi:hypothetical protein
MPFSKDGIMTNIPEFRPDLDADQAHVALKKSVEILDQVQHCALLWFGEIMRRKLYRDLGFSSMRSYATEELGFSPTRAWDFIRLARRLESLPMVKEQVASGELGYTKARETSSVADPTNELEWVRWRRNNHAVSWKPPSGRPRNWLPNSGRKIRIRVS